MQRIADFEKVSFGIYKASFEDNSAAQAAYDEIRLPKRATKGSAGYDFYAPIAFTLKSGESAVIPTGVRAKIDMAWALLIYPRSGLGFKYRLRLDNTVGIIDSDYYYSDNEGHIMIKLTNESRDKELTLAVGDRFAQGIFMPYGITNNDEADNTRNGGFGSTD